MQIESPSGYGLAERTCIGVNKKETTWCVALAELCSQIKYSPISPPYGGLGGQWRGWRGAQNRPRRQPERLQLGT
ncbi:hypothetical protein A3I36_04665 [Candidatus Giovannonibacteria bacterium RIFCSPLOWO2_02_FULL_45_28]|uniref:Uncharacterized protein n=1 Tax=Candidatus Giovannonibacteria bacterium RIFCSPHIGHO2_02_FULL_45_40 TaxID=1798337 RepID=A0A1F5WAY6_9BACT|nr:MAG: hypothetical protein A2120_04790 [Candidatus Giovannonibacteria bacterium GWA2_45_15]OGF60497.1 MAG: hypothetical protein A2W40_03280 [Candidatus Giovannonibacteria bacterium RIFCSPHIGHO2_01_45_12]OGF72826.1 MAG: hypothetical protein A3C05_00545 [Candidatus Giovannonibacteria bacterium RIFCSPHIGHO2_02_FULL_45_40]OGF85005.1 MAG: hypothetical protein A3E63_01480 [Candidatus Giovannonibacteria bacterium RIFCSPHIGHO2_12_FULL_45_19]OGF85301.1 MAG: hypothetical protein A3A19_01090 [Candidatus